MDLPLAQPEPATNAQSVIASVLAQHNIATTPKAAPVKVAMP